mmetsp:Transcript_20878/g.83203  ORF Transcript_20878/g.83203 Transcript_20878/m.83203 type:complete len:427 (+) Transcript_20878:175-1455(+)
METPRLCALHTWPHDKAPPDRTSATSRERSRVPRLGRRRGVLQKGDEAGSQLVRLGVPEELEAAVADPRLGAACPVPDARVVQAGRAAADRDELVELARANRAVPRRAERREVRRDRQVHRELRAADRVALDPALDALRHLLRRPALEVDDHDARVEARDVARVVGIAPPPRRGVLGMRERFEHGRDGGELLLLRGGVLPTTRRGCVASFALVVVRQVVRHERRRQDGARLGGQRRDVGVDEDVSIQIDDELARELGEQLGEINARVVGRRLDEVGPRAVELLLREERAKRRAAVASQELRRDGGDGVGREARVCQSAVRRGAESRQPRVVLGVGDEKQPDAARRSRRVGDRSCCSEDADRVDEAARDRDEDHAVLAAARRGHFSRGLLLRRRRRRRRSRVPGRRRRRRHSTACCCLRRDGRSTTT